MWLQKEAQGKSALVWTFAIVKINLIYSFAALWVLPHMGIIVPEVPGAEKFATDDVALILAMTPYVLLEELMFRFPLVILVWLQYSLRSVLMFALIFSILFGLAHGSSEHILIQGVDGFLLSLLFLKCGGLQGRPFKALACSFTAHWLYNASLIVISMTF